MGQTLTHGVYLPDEGERNCYNGLAANWSILDGAVGTVAEHTSQIAGKAPAVHTHTKADITDFPAYGTTAGTICEGNDSRLSDARTPVAHTHGKADITDLFNSANTWTDTNTYTVTGDVPIKITNNKDATNPSATEMKDIRFSDINGKIIGGVRHSLESGGTSKIHLYSRSFSLDGSSNSNHGLLIINNKQTGVHEVRSESNFIPSANNSYDLGSSSYQWNNLYAKNYYYNGTAWGLDKANEWTNTNIFASVMRQRINSVYSQTPTTDRFAVHEFVGTDNNRIFNVNCADRSSGQREISLMVYATDGTFQTSGLYKESDNSYSFKPRNNNVVNLGTSTNKWKTLNGLNPGALSLPSENASSVNLDPTNWVTDGSNYNSYTPPSDGWLAIQVHSADITDLTGQYVFAGRATGGTDYWPQGGLGVLKMVDNYNAKLIGQIFIPVISGKNFHITIKINKTQTEGSIIYARFYPCQGNV